jgi:hypothetical protein
MCSTQLLDSLICMRAVVVSAVHAAAAYSIHWYANLSQRLLTLIDTAVYVVVLVTGL